MIRIIIDIYCGRKRRRRCSSAKRNKAAVQKNGAFRRNRKKTRHPLYKAKRVKIFFSSKYFKYPRPDVSVKPVIARYFYIASHDINLVEENVIPSVCFVDDHGDYLTQFADFGSKGYFNLYINGVLQEGGLYQVNSDSLTFVASEQCIVKGTPIIVESVGFTAEVE